MAAGEAQIESTVTGNTSTMLVSDKSEALKDQSQVYLPINNALSEVGYVVVWIDCCCVSFIRCLYADLHSSYLRLFAGMSTDS